MNNNQIKYQLNKYESEIEYETNSEYFNPLPNKVKLYVYNDKIRIDISLDDNDVLNAEIWIEEDKVNISNDNINFIYSYFSKKLKKEIKNSKEGFNAQRYEDDLYNNFYIR